MYHQVTIVGLVANDPELRFTTSGVPVVNISIPISKYRGLENGQPVYDTVWVDATAWRKQAEYIGEHIKKLDRVLVQAELEKPQAWVDRDGNLTAKTALTIQFIKRLNMGETVLSDSPVPQEGGGLDAEISPPIETEAKRENASNGGKPTKKVKRNDDIPF